VIIQKKKVIELYDQGKSTRDIAKELRMSLRDISIFLRKYQVSHGNVMTKDNENDNNNRSPNEKATKAYKLFSEGKKPFEVDIELLWTIILSYLAIHMILLVMVCNSSYCPVPSYVQMKLARTELMANSYLEVYQNSIEDK
jgi:hypothetical protein